jgi:hypothetical protein
LPEKSQSGRGKIRGAGHHLVTKTGIDATRKADYPEEVSVPGVDEIDLREFIEDYEA